MDGFLATAFVKVSTHPHFTKNSPALKISRYKYYSFLCAEGTPDSHQYNAASSIIHLNVEGTFDKDIDDAAISTLSFRMEEI